MGLPKINMPIYELELPSNGKRIKFRPFTVKEEKILLIAQESKDINQMINGIAQIVNNCIFDMDVDDLALFDIIYLLINIRSKSVDNKVEFQIEDPDTKEKIDLSLDLSDIRVQKNKDHTNVIQIDDTYTLYLKYPNLTTFKMLTDGKSGESEDIDAKKSYEMLIACIDKLVSEDEVYKFSDFSKKETDDFVESLHSDVVKKLKQFFETMPTVRHEIPYTNSNGDKKIFVIEGTQTFFI